MDVWPVNGTDLRQIGAAVNHRELETFLRRLHAKPVLVMAPPGFLMLCFLRVRGGCKARPRNVPI